MAEPCKKVLSNGLTVLLQENHASPVVSFHLWAKIGSAQETKELAGICHLIEHMIFKGTGKRPVGQISQEVEAAGGDINAYTSFDETVFYLQMPSQNYATGLDILADSALDPTFDAEELAREKEVVVEEISRAEDSPSQMASEDLFATAFTTHTYGRPIAGDRNTVRAISRDTLLNFYRQWYVGSNLIFIGVGDFDIEKIFPEIDRLFAKIPAGKPPVVVIPPEPTQEKPRAITRAMPIEGYYFDLALPVPEVTHPDVPMLDVLAHLLGGGSSSRLEQALKEKKGLVAVIGSYAYTPKDPGLLVVRAVLKNNLLEKTVKAIWEEVEKLQDQPPATVEVARAKNAIRSGRIYEKQTVEGMARKLGFFEGTTGGLSFEEIYYQRLSMVTADDITRMAQKYFRPEKLTLSFVHPQGEKLSSEKIVEILRKLPPQKAPGKTIKANDPVKLILPNGIRLILQENRALPLISIRSASIGGLRVETPEQNGLAHLTALVQNKGTNHRTARELAEEVENLDGHMDSYAGKNLIGLTGSFLSEHITEGLDIFCDLLRFPSFPEEEIEKEKRHTITAIRNEQDSLTTVAMKQFLQSLYGKHPYGRSLLGTIATVKKLTRKAMVNYYHGIVRPDNLVITLVGDFSVQDIRERMKEKLGKWRVPGRLRLPLLRAPIAPQAPVTVHLKRKKFQAHVVLGFLGTTLKNPDRFALDVLNGILSGMGGRLFMELRDKQGLCYTVSSSQQEGIEPGFFMVYMGMDPEKLNTSLEGIKLELTKIKEQISDEEVDRAKRYLTGSYLLDLQKNSAVAGSLTHSGIFGLPLDLQYYPQTIGKITREDVLRVAKKYLRLDQAVLSLIHP